MPYRPGSIYARIASKVKADMIVQEEAVKIFAGTRYKVLSIKSKCDDRLPVILHSNCSLIHFCLRKKPWLLPQKERTTLLHGNLNIY